MKIEDIKKNPKKSLNYAERVVNNGSPSGFTEKNNTSPETNPFYTAEFNLARMINPDKLILFGNVPSFIDRNSLLIHPDWKKNICNVDIVDTPIKVIPTASARTVRFSNYDYYVKLSYPGILGRLNRELNERQINTVIEISSILKEMIKNRTISPYFAFLPEESGILFKKNNFKTGCLFRDCKPFGVNVDKIEYILPAFSIFSKDRENPNDLPLLLQITKDKDKEDYLLNQIIFPLMDIYFSCALNEGLILELHSQNVLFGFNKENDIVSIIIRDLESIDKDITIRKKLHKSDFINDFKTISQTDYNYKIKHSFMYDFKLGEYLVEEILNCLNSYNLINKNEVIYKIKNYYLKKYFSLTNDFFPNDGKWYKFDKVEINRKTKERPYLKCDNPILR